MKKHPLGITSTASLVAAIIVVVLTAVFAVQSTGLLRSGTNSMDDKPGTASPTAQVVQPDVAPPDVPEGWVQYVNEEYGYSFWYPDGIQVNGFDYTTHINEIQEHAYFVAKGIDALGGVEVRSESLADAKQAVIEFEESLYVPSEMTVDEEITLGGYNAVELLFQTNDGTGTIHILIENKNKTYDLSWVYQPLDNKTSIDYDDLGKKILSTFRID